MNDATLKKLVKDEEEMISNASSYDALMDVEEKQKTMLTMEKAQKLEHEERRMLLEESKVKLEVDKIDYQKKRDKKDNVVKIVVASVAAVPGIMLGIVKLIQIHIQRKAIREAYVIDGVTAGLSSKTARNVQTDLTNPKICMTFRQSSTLIFLTVW